MKNTKRNDISKYSASFCIIFNIYSLWVCWISTYEWLPISSSNPAVPQPLHGVSESESVAKQIGKYYEEAVEERSLAKTVEDNVIESLGLK